ncbi:MAG: transcription-repair coupling factor, partial [Gammaproteobacteria bacterium]|nr:transcription-repair coupling factor [Gammaproteobacteria bacterium]
KKSLIYRDVSEGIAPAGIEYYLPLFFEQTETLIDYLPAQSVIAQITDCGGALDTAWEQAAARYEQRRHDIERPILKPADIFFSPREINDKFTRHQQIDIHGFELLPDKTSPDNKKNFATAQPPSLILNKRGDEPAESLMEFLETFTGRILFAAESAGRREHILELLRRRGVRPRVFDTWKDFLRHDDQVGICIAPLAEGVHLKEAGVSIVCEAQIFGDRAKQRQKRRAERDPNSIIRDLTDLSNGAPVVHEEHGVGRYRGLQTLEVSGVLTEFLTLEYAAGDKLYVPVSSLHLITRYTGTAPEHAPLHRLGSDQWQKAKRRAAEKARDAAAELLEIYARRAAREGNILKAEETEYLAFTDSFPFEETTDQKSAIEQVVTDLSVPKPMDRLVCGDVGFGKTEVALRAAFVAVQSGKQVAILV